MVVLSCLFLGLVRRRAVDSLGDLQLSSPLSLPKVFKFGLIFLVIAALGTLAQRALGHWGVLLVSVIGGLVSSASTAGAAATLAFHGSIAPQTAGIATVLTSVMSALSNLPVFQQQVRNRSLTRTLALLSSSIVAVGLLAMAVEKWLQGKTTLFP
jgi:uncharacterized membrane protein (DUF4010 family)